MDGSLLLGAARPWRAWPSSTASSSHRRRTAGGGGLRLAVVGADRRAASARLGTATHARLSHAAVVHRLDRRSRSV